MERENVPLYGGKESYRGALLSVAIGAVLGAALFLLPLEAFVKLLAAAGGGAAVLYSPTWGLYLLAGSLPFLPNEALLLLAFLIGFSFLFQKMRLGNFNLHALPAEPAVSFFLLVLVLLTIFSITPVGSLRDMGFHLAAFTVFLVCYNQLETREQLYRFLLLALLVALVVSLYGIYQFAVGVEVDASWVDEEAHPLLRTRVFSFFGNPNVLAEYLLLFIPFGLALAWTAGDLLKKMLFLGITGAMVLTLLLTFSRGGWVGLAVAVFVFLLLQDRKALLALFFLGLVSALAGTAFLPEVFLQRILTIGSPFDTSNIYRILVWRESLLIISDYWTTGVGLGHQVFQEIYPYYMLTRDKTPFHAHNTYLQLLLEIGLAGFLVFFWFMVSTAKKGLKTLFRAPDPFLGGVIAASLAALAGLLAQGMVENVLYLLKIIMLFWLTIGLLFLSCRLHEKEKTASPHGSNTTE